MELSDYIIFNELGDLKSHFFINNFLKILFLSKKNKFSKCFEGLKLKPFSILASTDTVILVNSLLTETKKGVNLTLRCQTPKALASSNILRLNRKNQAKIYTFRMRFSFLERCFSRRKTLYYMYNIVFPCMMMSTLTVLVFCLPPDSGEKIALGN